MVIEAAGVPRLGNLAGSGLADILRRPERLTVSEWADRYRELDARFSAEPGRWSCERTPYLREIMDSFADRSVSRITFVKSARVGGSETINNALLYAADCDPGPVLYVLPTEDAAADEVKGRLRSMIESSERVRRLIPEHGDWATLKEIYLKTLTIWMAWAQAPVTLTRRTCRYVVIDELDNCRKAAGHLGDHLQLAAERTTTYGHRGRVLDVSTPTTGDMPAWAAWEASDQRRFYVPCPLCGVYQYMRFDRIRVPENERDHNRIEADRIAWYSCEGCDGQIPESRRWWMVERGVWCPEALRIVEKLDVSDVAACELAKCGPRQWRPQTEGERKPTRRIGFHVWSAYSPWRDWSSIFAEFLRTRDEPDKFRVFVNSWLGEPWKEAVEEVRVDDLRKQMTVCPRGFVPVGAVGLVAGADVQLDRIYYVVRAFGGQRQSWLVAEGVVGDFEELLLATTKHFQCQSDGTMSPLWLGVDSGFRTLEVYEFARSHPGVLATKGQQSGDFGVLPRNIEFAPKGQGRKAPFTLYHINTSHYKELIYRSARKAEGEIGAWHVHRDVSDDYLAQVTSEHQIWKTSIRGKTKRRQLVWEPRPGRPRNHYLDAEVIAMAIADHKGLLRIQQPTADPAVELPDPIPTRRPWGRGPIGYRPRQSISS